MEARKIFFVITTFVKCNKNSPVLQQMLKIVSSWPDALPMPTKGGVVY
jgi:hypothetical protein